MLSTLANSEICSVTSVTCSWCWYNGLTLFFLLSKIKNVIFFIIFRSKINCSHHLWESKVLGSWKFIFIRRNNIVKTINYVSFYFSYSLISVGTKKKTKPKRKHTQLAKSLCKRCPWIGFRHGNFADSRESCTMFVIYWSPLRVKIVITQAERPGFKFWLSFFFLLQSKIAVRDLQRMRQISWDWAPVARMVSSFQTCSSLTIYGTGSMICRPWS